MEPLLRRMKNNFNRVRRVLIFILVLNWLVAIMKMVVGYLSHSTSVMADGFHSLSDGSSNIVGLIGIALASRPANEEYPYGHSKYETLTTLGIAVILLFVSYQIIIAAISKFMHPVPLVIEPLTLILMSITLVINIWVVWYEKGQGKALHSDILTADAMHTKSDVIVTIGVILTLIALKFNLPLWIDPLVSLIVVGFILHEAYEIFEEVSGTLLDKAATNSKQITEIVLSVDGALAVHNIRSRGNLSIIYIDMHVMVEAAMSIEEGHDLCHRIEDAIRLEYTTEVQVIIHLEPYTLERANRHKI